MNNIPPELLYVVCSLLNVDDILNFRLVNKLFADVGAAHMLPEVTFYMHRGDFDRLEAISLHPVFSKHVSSLTYFAETLDPKVTWREFEQGHKRRMRWNGRLRKLNLTSAQLMAEYKKYSDAVGAQDKLMEGEKDVDLLKEVLPRFPRLKALTMSAGHVFYEGCYQTRRNKPFSEFLEKGYMGSAHPEGKRPLDALLRANAHSPCALTSLRAGMVHWRFFKRSERELARIFKPLANLTTLSLSVSVDPADERIHEGNSLRKCQRVLAKGAIRNILQHMPQLESLYVEIQSLEYSYTEKGAQLSDVIEPGFHWPNLKELFLGGIVSDRTEIMNVLLLHKDRLRKLCLRDVILASTSWRKLLPDIRKNLCLEVACICGDIYGMTEYEADTQDSWDEAMDILDLEYWGLSVPEVDSDPMRDSIDVYCRQGGESYPDELPLSSDIVDKYYNKYVKPFFENDEWEDISDEELDDDDDDDDNDDNNNNNNMSGSSIASLSMERAFLDMMLGDMLGMGGDDDEDDLGMLDEYDFNDLGILAPPLPDLDSFSGSPEHPSIDSDDEMPDLVS